MERKQTHKQHWSALRVLQLQRLEETLPRLAVLRIKSSGALKDLY